MFFICQIFFYFINYCGVMCILYAVVDVVGDEDEDGDEGDKIALAKNSTAIAMPYVETHSQQGFC